MQKTICFYIVVLTLFLGICSPFLFSYGMFLDGTTYATIAQNMAIGKGSFWMPYYTETLYSTFYEHPPLALWLESLFFRIFGTSIFVERFYSVLSIMLVGFLIVKIWKEITGEIITAWFPLLLFVLFPIITWTATNNMLENTMSFFICTSVLFYLKSIRKQTSCWTVIGGLSLFLGTLSKGIVAFFPWTLPFLLWLFLRKISFKQVIRDTIILIVFAVFPIILLYISSENAKLFFDSYLSNQLFSSVTGMRETIESRFFILQKLLENSIITLVLTTGLIIVQIKKKKTDLIKKEIKKSLVFLTLSLCGVLPIMLSLKQSEYYIIPAYPFLAIAFALPFQAIIKEWHNKIDISSRSFIVFKIVSCLALVSVTLFSISQKGKISREEKTLKLVFECNKYIPSNSVISIDKETYREWGLHANFARYKNISLDDNEKHLYYLHNKHLPILDLDEEYVHLTDIDNYSLLRYDK